MFLSAGHTGCQHALDIVANITENNSVSLGAVATSWACGEGLDLEALENWDGEPLVCDILAGEDGPEETSCQFGYAPDGTDDGGVVGTYSKAPSVIACRASEADILGESCCFV